uniref:Uncharacterized protein n=1 Tax=Glossina palpalis gambiensis TaxID=67801 RepID=A0A1B0B426_9MUSC
MSALAAGTPRPPNNWLSLLPLFPTILVVLVGSFGFLGRWFFASVSNNRQLSSGSYTKASNTAIKESLLRLLALDYMILAQLVPNLCKLTISTGECLRMESKILKAAFLRATEADFEATVKG